MAKFRNGVDKEAKNNNENESGNDEDEKREPVNSIGGSRGRLEDVRDLRSLGEGIAGGLRKKADSEENEPSGKFVTKRGLGDSSAASMSHGPDPTTRPRRHAGGEIGIRPPEGKTLSHSIQAWKDWIAENGSGNRKREWRDRRQARTVAKIDARIPDRFSADSLMDNKVRCLWDK